MRRIKLIILVLLCFNALCGFATVEETKKDNTIIVDLFVKTGCPYCHDAQQFLNQYSQQNSWVSLHVHNISEDKRALKLFANTQSALGVHDFSVPVISFCHAYWRGFNKATSSEQIKQALKDCYQIIQTKGYLDKQSQVYFQTLSQSSVIQISHTSNGFKALIVSVAGGVFSALNPCSLFIVIFTFALLALSNRQANFTLVVSFLVTWALIHILNILYPALYYHYISFLRVPAFIVGLLGLMIAIVKIKPNWLTVDGLILLGFAIFLGFIGYTYQQQCSLNLGFIFKQWVGQYTLFQMIIYWCVYTVSYLLVLGLITKGLIALYLKRKVVQIFATLCLIESILVLLLYPMFMQNFLWSLGLVLANGILALSIKIFYRQN